MTKRLFAALCSMAFAAMIVLAQEGPKGEMKEAGHDIKKAAKSTGHAAKHTGKGIAKGTKKGVHKTAKKAREGSEKLEDKTK